MQHQTVIKHKLINLGQTLLLILGLSFVLAVSVELIFGAGIWPWVMAGVAFSLLLAPEVSPHWILRLYSAHPLTVHDAPRLVALVDELARRSELDRLPPLYWIPSRTINAFAVGSRNNAAIAITDGLLKTLSLRQLTGVLAHEMSHISNNDMRIMGLANTVSRFTNILSVLGVLLAVLTLPLMLVGISTISIPGLLLLILAPGISALLQLGLSRAREFDADLDAARLTGDPEGLASALDRITRRKGSLWQRILFPGYRDTDPSLLRTHPNTEERIRRLLALRGKKPLEPFIHRSEMIPALFSNHFKVMHRPRPRLNLIRFHGL